MSKKDGTAASMAHPPADKSHLKDLPYAHNYPGKKAPKGAKVSEETGHNAKELAAGRAMAQGVSSSGSHKALPANKSRDYVGHEGYDTSKEAPMGAKMSKVSTKHNAAELESGRANSMGTSADGSHKGLPMEYAVAGQDGYKSPKA